MTARELTLNKAPGFQMKLVTSNGGGGGLSPALKRTLPVCLLINLFITLLFEHRAHALCLFLHHALVFALVSNCVKNVSRARRRLPCADRYCVVRIVHLLFPVMVAVFIHAMDVHYGVEREGRVPRVYLIQYAVLVVYEAVWDLAMREYQDEDKVAAVDEGYWQLEA